MKTITMNRLVIYIILAALAGATTGVALLSIFTDTEIVQEDRKPLYWVAPMNPDFRSDSPGKSPMGMDLVPVYEDSQPAQSGPGVVTISPSVENNLGVRTTVVEEGPFTSNIRTVGYVRFDEDRLVNLHPRVEGWIEELFVKAQGEFIAEGEALYSIYSPTLVAAQEELLLAIERQNQRLVESAEQRLLALQVPESLINTVKSRLEVLRNVTVFAPQDGLIASLEVREGQFVQPGNQIMSIGVLDEVWVIAEVFERQVAQVKEGNPVNMTLDYLPGLVWQGVVDFIYPTLDEQTRTVPVRLRFRNPGQELKPNMFAQVQIQHSEEGRSALLVPNAAIIRTGTQDRVVLALGDGSYKSIEISLGRRGDEYTEILEGLMAGDRVVTSAHFLLDSESSISSDFQRMFNTDMSAVAEPSLTDELTAEQHESHANTSIPRIRSEGRIEHIMANERMVSITHDPIPEWEWPAMTMSFELDPEIEIGQIVEGVVYSFDMTRLSGNKIIVSDLLPLSNN